MLLHNFANIFNLRHIRRLVGLVEWLYVPGELEELWELLPAGVQHDGEALAEEEGADLVGEAVDGLALPGEREEDVEDGAEVLPQLRVRLDEAEELCPHDVEGVELAADDGAVEGEDAGAHLGVGAGDQVPRLHEQQLHPVILKNRDGD